MAIGVTSGVAAGLIAEARRAYPRECCGLLLGGDDTITAFRPTTNVHCEPATNFEIDPQALIDMHRAMRSGGPRLIGYYHSHPAGSLEPSRTDSARAAGDAMIWAIVGANNMRLWRATPAGFSALSYTPV